MRYDQMRQKFREGGYRQPNFMTPDCVDMVKRGNMLIEISKGTGIGGDTLYGVTFLELPRTQRNDLSTCLDTRAECDSYINQTMKRITS